MKYNELKKIAEDNEYEINDNIDYVTLKKYQGENIIKISAFHANLIFPHMFVCFGSDLQMLRASIEYSETPLEDRYPEKKKYLRHRFLLKERDDSYLNYYRSLGTVDLSDRRQTEYIQTQFTQAEINEIKEKYDTDLKDFEIIEVEEWEYLVYKILNLKKCRWV